MGPEPAKLQLSRLLQNDASTLAGLAAMLQDHGMFHLDFADSEYAYLLEDRNALYKTAEATFALPLATKLVHDIDRVSLLKIDGYKPAGITPGVSEGKKDGFEAIFTSQDSVMSSDLDLPGNLLLSSLALKKLGQRFVSGLHGVVTVLLRAISRVLELPESILIGEHLLHGASASSLGLLRYQNLGEDGPNVGHGAHTDVGTLSVLFSTEPGLQVYSREADDWYFIDPQENCAVVNVGDSLRFLTGRPIVQCLHRVVPSRTKAHSDKMTCAYFLRPSYLTEFVDDEGKKWRYIDWHARKYKTFKAPFHEQARDSTLTSLAGYLGHWSAEN